MWVSPQILDLKHFGVAGWVKVDIGNGRTVTHPVLTENQLAAMRREYEAELRAMGV